VLPSPLWIALGLISAVIFVYMLFFADRAERAKTQALLMGSVTAVITVMLLLLVFLERPYREGAGGLRPAAMERSLAVVDATFPGRERAPCDARGRRL
jgi:hypothetical protein